MQEAGSESFSGARRPLEVLRRGSMPALLDFIVAVSTIVNIAVSFS